MFKEVNFIRNFCWNFLSVIHRASASRGVSYLPGHRSHRTATSSLPEHKHAGLSHWPNLGSLLILSTLNFSQLSFLKTDLFGYNLYTKLFIHAMVSVCGHYHVHFGTFLRRNLYPLSDIPLSFDMSPLPGETLIYLLCLFWTFLIVCGLFLCMHSPTWHMLSRFIHDATYMNT